MPAIIDRRSETKRRQGGFTLIEVLMSIVILSVGLLSLAQMMVLATRSNSLAGRMTSSAALAREQLEILKAAPFYSNPALRARNPVLQDGGDVEAGGGAPTSSFSMRGGSPWPETGSMKSAGRSTACSHRGFLSKWWRSVCAAFRQRA